MILLILFRMFKIFIQIALESSGIKVKKKKQIDVLVNTFRN